MISIKDVNALSTEEFVTTLGGIYEHSAWVPQQIADQRPFRSFEELLITLRQAVNGSSDEEKLELIRKHPDLAGKLALSGGLTESSTREQSGLGLDRLSAEEYSDFSTKNQRYREKFGFPFIICARLTTKEGVLMAFESRLQNSREEEVAEALFQIHEIARLRLGDTVY
jgi:2-oxo-4-hydroxy-4-carboxy-5-ureidoimidazoline decarboxylase